MKKPGPEIRKIIRKHFDVRAGKRFNISRRCFEDRWDAVVYEARRKGIPSELLFPYRAELLSRVKFLKDKKDFSMDDIVLVCNTAMEEDRFNYSGINGCYDWGNNEIRMFGIGNTDETIQFDEVVLVLCHETIHAMYATACKHEMNDQDYRPGYLTDRFFSTEGDKANRLQELVAYHMDGVGEKYLRLDKCNGLRKFIDKNNSLGMER